MVCSGNISEAMIQSAVVEAARMGELGSQAYGPNYCVIRQQIASYIFQSPKRSRRRETIEDFVSTVVGGSTGSSVLDHMISSNELIEDREGLRLGEVWLERSDKGEIHSNVEGAYGLAVVDEKTGRELVGGITLTHGKTLQIGGNLLEVKKWKDMKLEVGKASAGSIADATWSYCTHSWVAGAGQPEAMRIYLGFAEGEWPLVQEGENTYVFHLGGGRRQAILEMIPWPDRRTLLKVNEWFLVFCGEDLVAKPEWMSRVGAGMVELEVHKRVEKLERTLGRPRSNRKLPLQVRIEEIKSWLQIDKEIGLLRNCLWVPVEDSDHIKALHILLRGIGRSKGRASGHT